MVKTANAVRFFLPRTRLRAAFVATAVAGLAVVGTLRATVDRGDTAEGPGGGVRALNVSERDAQLLVGRLGLLAHNNSAQGGRRPWRARHLRHVLPVPEGLDETTAALTREVHEQAIRRLQETFTPTQLAELFEGKVVHLLPSNGPGLVVRGDTVFVNPHRLASEDAERVLEQLSFGSLVPQGDTAAMVEALPGARSFAELAQDGAIPPPVRNSAETEWEALRLATGRDSAMDWDERMRQVGERGVNSSLPADEAADLQAEAQLHPHHIEHFQLDVPRLLRQTREVEELIHQPGGLSQLSVRELEDLESRLSVRAYGDVLDLEDELRVSAAKEHVSARLDEIYEYEDAADLDLDAPDSEEIPRPRALEDYRVEAGERFENLAHDAADLMKRRGLAVLSDDPLLVLEKRMRDTAYMAQLSARTEVEPFLDVVEEVGRRGRLQGYRDESLTELLTLLGRFAERAPSPTVQRRIRRLSSDILDIQIRRFPRDSQ